jgi:hypothetical protein
MFSLQTSEVLFYIDDNFRIFLLSVIVTSGTLNLYNCMVPWMHNTMNIQLRNVHFSHQTWHFHRIWVHVWHTNNTFENLKCFPVKWAQTVPSTPCIKPTTDRWNKPSRVQISRFSQAFHCIVTFVHVWMARQVKKQHTVAGRRNFVRRHIHHNYFQNPRPCTTPPLTPKKSKIRTHDHALHHHWPPKNQIRTHDHALHHHWLPKVKDSNPRPWTTPPLTPKKLG